MKRSDRKHVAQIEQYRKDDEAWRLSRLEKEKIPGLNPEAIAEWVEYRKDKKKPLSELALKKSKNFLLKYPEDHQQYLVDQAIMNDWQGLHHKDMPVPCGTSTKDSTLLQDLTDTSWAD